MRHGRKVNHLSRTSSHRKAMLSNMATSLILHKRIETTVAKAKALRVYVDPIITRSKDNTTHSRRLVFSLLKSKEAIKELFSEVAGKVASRPGGYTRIIRLGNRLGDNAETCMMELVDFNEVYTNEKKEAKAGAGKKRTRRGKGGAKADEAAGTKPAAAVAGEAAAPEAKAKAPKAEKAAAPEAEAKAAPKAEKKAEEPKKAEHPKKDKPAAEEGDKK